MRSFNFSTVLGFVLLACFGLMAIGCGSDDAPTTSVGSLTDPNFVAVQSQIETLVDSTIAFAFAGMNSPNSISTEGSVDPVLYGPAFTDSNNVTITYAGGWHVFNGVISNSVYSFNILDSVQFYNNDDISQQGVGADSIWYRHHWSYNVENTQVSYTEFEGFAGFDYRGLNGDVAVIDGSNELVIDNQYVSQDSTTFRHFEFATTVNDLNVNKTGVGWAQACPNSGSISASVSVMYAKDDAPVVTTQWDVAMTFTDGSAAVTVSSGNTTWTYSTDVCIAVN